MKPNTVIWIAFRNIGDSQDSGSVTALPLRDALLWLVTRFGEVSMATRIVIGVGRNESEARLGIEVAGSGKAKVTESMSKMLDNMMANIEWHDDESDAVSTPVTATQIIATRIEGDDYHES